MFAPSRSSAPWRNPKRMPSLTGSTSALARTPNPAARTGLELIHRARWESTRVGSAVRVSRCRTSGTTRNDSSKGIGVPARRSYWTAAAAMTAAITAGFNRSATADVRSLHCRMTVHGATNRQGMGRFGRSAPHHAARGMATYAPGRRSAARCASNSGCQPIL